MGRVIAAYRVHPWHGRPLSQELVAGWLSMTQAQLSRIESGRAPQELSKLISWARSLGVPARLLWFKLPIHQQRQSLVVEVNERLRRLRLARAWTQEELAERVCDHVEAATGRRPSVDASVISRLECGATTWPSRATRNALRVLLGVGTDAALGLYPKRALPDATMSRPTADVHAWMEFNVMRRRAFLASGLAMTAVPMLTFDDLAHLAAALTDAHRYLDTSVVGYFRRQLDACAVDDGERGPKETLPVVLGIVGAVETRAREVKPAVRRELIALGARGAEFTGWLYRDIGALTLAAFWRDRATEWAQEAGDQPMQGYVLLKKSQAAWDDRDGLRMLTLAQAAQEGPWHLPPTVLAEAAQQEARGQAMTGGDLATIERILGKAHQLLSSSNTDDGQVSFGAHYNPALLAMQTAICYQQAGHPDRAISTYETHLTDEAFSRRDYGYFRALHASALAAVGEPDQASNTGHEALTVGVATHSSRTVHEITRVATQLSPWANRQTVRDLRDAIPA